MSKFAVVSGENRRRKPYRCKKVDIKITTDNQEISAVPNTIPKSSPTSPTEENGALTTPNIVPESYPTNPTAEISVNSSTIEDRVIDMCVQEVLIQNENEIAPYDSNEISEEEIEPKTKTIEVEIARLQDELQQLRLSHNRLSIQDIKSSEFLIRYTGISKECFEVICNLVETVEFKYVLGYQSSLSLQDQILMTLMKLKLNLNNLDLSYRFKIAESDADNIICTLISVLHEILYVKLMDNIPSERKNEPCLPSAINLFPSCRIILDCTEFQCDIPADSLDLQERFYSPEKRCHSIKVLIGIAPNGVITYLSPAYPGCTSDRSIVQHCKIMDKMNPGDMIIADKGFTFRDLLPQGVSLNTPSFLSNPTRNTAHARVHVERAIRKLKYFHILDFIPISMFPYVTEVIQLCGALTNFRPLVMEVRKNTESVQFSNTPPAEEGGSEMHDVLLHNDEEQSEIVR